MYRGRVKEPPPRVRCSTCYLRLKCTESRDRSPPPPVAPAKQKRRLSESLFVGGVFFGTLVGLPFALGLLVVSPIAPPSLDAEFFKASPFLAASPSPSPSPAPPPITKGLALK
jgi:hypothetical protein